MEVNKLYDPAALPSKERTPGTHWVGGGVGPRFGQDAVAYLLTYLLNYSMVQDII
jgi:hypothetical protein